MTVVILGCGYTGIRVAQRFLSRGAEVIATSRDPWSLDLPGARRVAFDSAEPVTIEVPEDALVLHSIPDPTPELRSWFTRLPRRMVYLSTTGVYGARRDVDENTPPSPETESAKQRMATEAVVRGGPWSSLVLRPAAIYGPGRGIQVSMREGRFQLAGDGENFVSRIHVDDLAAHVEAGLLSDAAGAFPVGDELPCTSIEIATYCSQLLGVPMPPSAPREALHETRRADRRVDGRAIRELLAVRLVYPTYREGLAGSV